MVKNEHDLIDGKKPSAFFRDIAKTIRDTKVKLGPYNPDAPFARSITIKAPDEDGYKDIGKRLRKGEKVYGLLQKWKPPIGSTKFREEDADIEHLWDDRNDNLKSKPKGAAYAEFIGDEVYEDITTRAFIDNHRMSQDALSLKQRMMSHAINYYMPPDKFAAYLDYFMHNLDDPKIRESVEQSLEQAFYQLGADGSISEEEYRAFAGDVANKRDRDTLSMLADIDTGKDMTEHTGLLLATACFHAAHRSYLSGLKKAINSPQMALSFTPGQRDTAHRVLTSTSFKQFNSFLIFQSHTNLTLMESDEQSTDDPAHICPHITEGWKRFSENSVLSTTFAETSIPDAFTPNRDASGQNHLEGKRLTCPALIHLRHARENHLIEKTYEEIAKLPKDHRLWDEAKATAEKIELSKAEKREAIAAEESQATSSTTAQTSAQTGGEDNPKNQVESNELAMDADTLAQPDTQRLI
ncbi:MAG: hypothetical protein MRY32_04880 [Rickettsiales bacterium]|nr:hypothetical protein [Rickettsiales bacterium]